MYFEIHKNFQAPQKYWWVIKSQGNHARLAHSELYTSKAACIHAMQIVANGAGAALYYDKTGE